MLPFKLVYSDAFDLKLGDHVFPSVKFRMIRDRLLAEGLAGPANLVEPPAATEEDLLLVHTPAWVRKILTGGFDGFDIMRLEIPVSGETIAAFRLAAGGTILAARRALAERMAGVIGGGFHHACPGHGEGFCAVNDLAVAIRRLQKDGLVRRAMVVDVDVHHGNGTAACFSGDASVFTLSIHQFNNYPAVKPPSTVDIHLPDGTRDDEYLSKLDAALAPALAEFRPELMLYVAGADPYEQDQLGGLKLTLDGLARRDRLVFDRAVAAGVPVAILLGGGYAVRVEDTVTIHVNTLLAARDALSGVAGSGARA